MDTTGFFDYPTEPTGARRSTAFRRSSAVAGDDDWAMLLDHTETRLFSPGRSRPQAGASATARCTCWSTGWVKAPSGVVHPITTLGEAAFLDGAPRAVSHRSDERG